MSACAIRGDRVGTGTRSEALYEDVGMLQAEAKAAVQRGETLAE